MAAVLAQKHHLDIIHSVNKYLVRIHHASDTTLGARKLGIKYWDKNLQGPFSLLPHILVEKDKQSVSWDIWYFWGSEAANEIGQPATQYVLDAILVVYVY